MGSVAAGNDDIWRISGDWLVGKYGSPMSPRPQCHKALREQGCSGATRLEESHMPRFLKVQMGVRR